MPNPMQDPQTPLILASASSRRLNLLAQIQIFPDTVIPANIDEVPHRNELPAHFALRMAREKAAHVASSLMQENTDQSERACDDKQTKAFILAGDTVVAMGRRILPKAENVQEVFDCLAILSGRRHRIYGGIALHLPDGTVRQRLVQSHVRFRRLSAVDISQYIDSGDWQGKAGCYAIQGLAARFIRDIAGSYSNVVGLSLYDVAAMLDAAGWRHGFCSADEPFTGEAQVTQSSPKERS